MSAHVVALLVFGAVALPAAFGSFGKSSPGGSSRPGRHGISGRPGAPGAVGTNGGLLRSLVRPPGGPAPREGARWARHADLRALACAGLPRDRLVLGHEVGRALRQQVLAAEPAQSLAIVGRVFRKTENRLTEDILEKQVTPPFKKSFDTINNLLNGG